MLFLGTRNPGGSNPDAYYLRFLVRPEGFEPPAFGSVDQRSIQLSYERMY